MGPHRHQLLPRRGGSWRGKTPLAVEASPEVVEDSSPSAPHQKSSHQGLTSVSSSPDVLPPRPHLHWNLLRSGRTAGLHFLPLLPRSGPTRTHLHRLLPRSGCAARPHLLLLLPRSGPTWTPSPSTPPQEWSHLDPISIGSSLVTTPPAPHRHCLPQSAGAMEAWRQCAHWLVAARVLPAGHRASSPAGQVWDLAQALRDGVLLCHLLNALLPRAVPPPRHLSPSPDVTGATRGKYSPGERNCPRVG